jgi:predicted dehydrogenase
MKLRIAFIGTGGISRVHLQCLKMREDVEISGLCDINPEALEKRTKEFGGKPFSDFQQMLDEIRPDAVWICTPTGVRYEPLIACKKRDIPVFCEKPVARTVEEGEKILDELGDFNSHVQVGYVFRSMPVTGMVKDLIREDKIHSFLSFYCNNSGLSKRLSKWFYDKQISGGALLDQATHNFDLLRYLLGEVEEVQGTWRNPVTQKTEGYTIEEVIAVNMVFKNGIVGTHVHTCVGDAWRNHILLSGEKRTYWLNLNEGELKVEGESTSGINLWETDNTNKKARVFQQGKDKSIYHYENVVFLEMVSSQNWSKNPCTYEDGLKSLKCTLACDTAITNQQRIILQ